MATANFPRPNASKYFVVLQDWTENEYLCEVCGETNDEYGDAPNSCDHCGSSTGLIESSVDTSPSTEDWNEFLPELWHNHLKDLGYDMGRTKNGIYVSKTVTKGYADMEIGFELVVCLRSGYYTAALLDWSLEGMGLNEFDSEVEIALDYSELNPGMKAILRPKMEKWMQTTSDAEIAALEQVFEQVSDTYCLIGRASNGEAFYQKV